MTSLPTTQPSATASLTSPRQAPRLLLVGDSITQFGEDVFGDNAPGWVALLRHRVGVCMHVMNYGRSGYNTIWGSRLLLRALVAEPNASAVVLFFGANDAAVPPNDQSVPIDLYKRNLSAMVSCVQFYSNAAPILITPPPIDNQTRGPDRRFERTKCYAEACVEVANLWNVASVDLHSLMVNRGISPYLSDGLHLSRLGNKVLEECVVDVLEASVHVCAPSKLEHPFLDWKDIDIDDVDSCIGPGVSL